MSLGAQAASAVARMQAGKLFPSPYIHIYIYIFHLLALEYISLGSGMFPDPNNSVPIWILSDLWGPGTTEKVAQADHNATSSWR